MPACDNGKLMRKYLVRVLAELVKFCRRYETSCRKKDWLLMDNMSQRRHEKYRYRSGLRIREPGCAVHPSNVKDDDER